MATAKKKSKKRRYKLKKPVKLMRFAVFAVVFILVGVLLWRINSKGWFDFSAVGANAGDVLSGNPQSARGMTIGGVDVEGLTQPEVVAKVKPLTIDALGSIQITITTPQNQVQLDAEDIGAYSDLEQIAEQASASASKQNYTVGYFASLEKIAAALAPFREEFEVAAVEPYAEPSLDASNTQHFDFHEGTAGSTLDTEAMAAQILERLARREFKFALEPRTVTVQPTLSLVELKANTRRRATFTTRFRDSTSVETIKNRVFNIQKATDIINCYTVQPGEEWSFNGVVGLRSVSGGWKEANGISGGKEYTLQAGGGICQVSTTLYNTLLRGNIKVTDRRAHSIPSDYVDKGLDATVDSGGIDLKFENDTGLPLYIFAYIKPDPENNRYATITVSLYGKPLESGVTYQPRSEISEVTERTPAKFTNDASIPVGYQLETVPRHDGYVADVYLDMCINGKVDTSTLLYKDKYRGNVAEISIGTGDPATTSVPDGAVRTTQAAPPADNSAATPTDDAAVG